MKTKFYSGLLLCAIVVANALWWIVASMKEDTFGQAKSMYLSYFPEFLSNTSVLASLTIAICILSVYLLIRSQSQLSGIYRPPGLVLTILNGLLISWQLFILM